MLPEAKDAWLEATDRFIGNPSSPHRLGSRADAALSHARHSLAEFLECDPLDLIWTSSATESANSILHHFSRDLDSTTPVWISSIEHPCVLAAARRFFPSQLHLIPALPSGVVDLDWITDQLKRIRPGLIAVMAANNETGVLQPWPEVLKLCQSAGVPFFCDATQWIGKLPAAGLGACDCLAGSAHKFGGPKGAGFLKCPSQGPFHSLLLGGQQEEGRRAGTENVAGVLSMLAALQIREHAILRGEHVERSAWQNDFIGRLESALAGTVVIGKSHPRLWNTVAALMPEGDCRQRWVVKLDREGVAVSTGSACASGREEPSHVLAALGFQPDHASRALRFSSGWETTQEEWSALLDALITISRTFPPSPPRTTQDLS